MLFIPVAVWIVTVSIMLLPYLLTYKKGVSIQGTVRRVNRLKFRICDEFTYTVEYIIEGKAYVNSLMVVSVLDKSVGDKIDIKYNVKNPDKIAADCEDDCKKYEFIYIFLVGVPLIIAAVLELN